MVFDPVNILWSMSECSRASCRTRSDVPHRDLRLSDRRLQRADELWEKVQAIWSQAKPGQRTTRYWSSCRAQVRPVFRRSNLSNGWSPPSSTTPARTAYRAPTSTTSSSPVLLRARRRNDSHQSQHPRQEADGPEYRNPGPITGRTVESGEILVVEVIVFHAHAATAPRGALLYPRLSREGLGGRFLGLMADLDGKPEGDNSMPGK